MTLGQKQELFSRLLAEFVCWVYSRGYAIRWGEVYRPPETAELYAKQGKGIRNSNHCKKLAADLFLVENGKVTWEFADYYVLGEKWKSMHELCRWGGDFKGRDAVHFSIYHAGVS